MPFTLSIPPPAAMRVGHEQYLVLPSGTELHRLHHSDYKGAAYNGTAGGNARFSPINDTSGQIIPTIYGGQTFECAVCEIILRCPDSLSIHPTTGLPSPQIVFPSTYRAYQHSLVRTIVDFKLVDLRISAQRRIGVNQNALLAGPRSTYPETRGWAEKIHEACPSAQGLYYTCHQWGNDFAVVLFGDRIPAAGLQELSTRDVATPSCHDEISALASQLGIDYQDV